MANQIHINMHTDTPVTHKLPTQHRLVTAREKEKMSGLYQ